MENIYAQLEIELYASKTEICAARERIRNQIVALNRDGDEEGLLKQRQLLQSVVSFLRKTAEQKQEYDSALELHFKQCLYKEQQEKLRVENIETEVIFTLTDAIRIKNFDYLDNQGLLCYLSYAEIETIKQALSEIVDYYNSLEEIYWFPDEFRASLHFQIDRAPHQIIERMTDNKTEFERALFLTKEGAFLAARAKVKPNTLTRRTLEKMMLRKF